MNKNNQNKIEEIVDLIQQKKFNDAENKVLTLLESKKDASLINLYGIILLEQKNYHDAITKFKLALNYDPNFVKSYNNLGIVLHKLEKYHDACKNYQKAIKINPDFFEAYNNMGVSLIELRKYNNAEKYFKKSISIRSNFLDPYINLGKLLVKINNFTEAINYFQKALKLKKNEPKIIHSLGLAYKKNLEYKIAESKFKLAIKLNPNFPEAFINLGILYREMNLFNDAIKCFKKAMYIDPKSIPAYSNLLFTFSYIQNCSVNDYKKYSKKYRNILKVIDNECLDYKFEKKPKKLKVGFVSGDLGNHSVGYFLFDLIKILQTKNIETYAYSNKDLGNDYKSLQLKMDFNYWRDIFDKKDLETINLIRNDGIHILIDLSGHTDRNRLSIFPSRPAPIQLTWLGCNISTGIPEIDYIISDKHSYKDEQKEFFVEKFWDMPQVLQCFSKDNSNLILQETPAIKNQFITFGSFNNSAKLNDKVIQIWSKILKNVKNSKIFLKNYLVEDKEIKQILIKKFNHNNIKENRLIIKKQTKSRKESLEMYNEIDIALDTFPYNGVTTSHEAILMGVPVLTKKGDRPHSKMGESLNSNINMTEWIAKDAKDYIDKATKFSKNISKLSKIRKELIRKAPLTSSFDCNIFGDQFEKELWKIWYKFYNNYNN